MRRDPAGHEIEALVRIGKAFGGVLPGFHDEAAFGREFTGAVEHRLGEIGEGDLVSEAGEMQPRVPAARCHIEHAGLVGKRDFFEGGGDIGDIGENMSPAVTLTLPGELFLGGLLHVIKFHRLKR